MRNTLLYSMLACSAALLTVGCTDVNDEFGCDATMSMQLTGTSANDGNSYSATFTLHTDIRDLAGNAVTTMGYYGGPGDVVYLSKAEQEENGAVSVTINGLRYGQEYQLHPFFETEYCRFEGQPTEKFSQQPEDFLEFALGDIAVSGKSATVAVDFNSTSFQQNYFGAVGVEVATDADFQTEVKRSEQLSKQQHYSLTVGNLLSPVTYYCRAYYYRSGNQKLYDDPSFRVYSDVKTFQTSDLSSAVDLGLSVRWADHNIGSTEGDDFGTFFTWSYTKNEVNSGTSISGTSEDAATKLWGSQWRMPTKAEMEELVEKCTWTAVMKGLHYEWQVKGPSGATISLPCGGLFNHREGHHVWYSYERAYYWTATDLSGISTLADDRYNAYFLYADKHYGTIGVRSNQTNAEEHTKLHQMLVRPVLNR